MTILVLLVLLLYRSSVTSVSATSPVDLTFARADAASPVTLTPTPHTSPDLRSIWNITSSCLTTIFACSWVSVHPDIPPMGQNWRRNALRRLEYMVWTILTPEMVILWAARQWFGARDIANTDYGSDIKWTRTHGHFLQMGGFMLYNGKEPRGVVCHARFKYLLETNRIAFPEVTEDEILDRSKSDGLGKTLAAGQTAWFILQCIVRKSQGLGITELELATLAFAALNIFMYIFWWDKPFDVRIPIPVQLLETQPQRVFLPYYLIGYEPASSTLTLPLDATISHNIEIVSFQTPEKSTPASSTNIAIQSVWRLLQVISRRLHSLKENASQIQEFEEYYEHLHDDIPLAGEFERPMYIDYTKLMKLPPYYARMTNMKDERLINLFIAVIAMVFGGIHCGGWFFHFPSTAELWIWRSCSLLIAGIPICYIAVEALWKTKEYTGYGLRYNITQHLYNSLNFFFSYVCVPLYILARVVLVVEVFIAMRDMSPDVYVDINWITFLPHV
ncbi:LOW QUALITY PROTEIN: hypothetical protein CVT25_010004 [Psilocybe cyanescens]|uniref:Uncharacterized protein n=1 Tax=Psilocybe cyanescens TaxID=93625 RepID=A0A409X3A8_PSICY|nr:LOW QUALITY PROTEIN: hypothetical protein CVT25_010004 [Psilocybe cyanescens]